MGNARPKPPCKACPDRRAGCHGKCEKWAAYKQADAEWKAEHQKPPEHVTNYFVDRDVNIHKIMRRKTGKKP